MKNHNLLTAVAFASALLVPGIALAAGNDQSGPTVGDCVSDGLYGNEPNIVGPFAEGGPAEQEPGTIGGRVVPSHSPGPFVSEPGGNEPPRNDRVRGLTVGEIQQDFGVIVPQLCAEALPS